MINRLTVLVNDALRKRWSTVILLALLLTGGKAYAVWTGGTTEWQTFGAQVFLAFIISFVVSLALHVILFTLGPKKKEEIVAAMTTPSISKEQHEANIKALNKELEAVQKADAAAQVKAGTAPAPVKETKPINLAKELGVRTRPAKKKSPAKKSAPKKKAAKKKK